jgi:hypothetical protein
MIPRFATIAMASPKPEGTQHKLLRDPLSWYYNVAPSTMQPIFRQNRDTGERELA